MRLLEPAIEMYLDCNVHLQVSCTMLGPYAASIIWQQTSVTWLPSYQILQAA